MKKVKSINAKTAATALEIQRIGNLAMSNVQKENRRLGLPNIYSRNGKLIYEMPDGKIVVKE